MWNLSEHHCTSSRQLHPARSYHRFRGSLARFIDDPRRLQRMHLAMPGLAAFRGSPLCWKRLINRTRPSRRRALRGARVRSRCASRRKTASNSHSEGHARSRRGKRDPQRAARFHGNLVNFKGAPFCRPLPPRGLRQALKPLRREARRCSGILFQAVSYARAVPRRAARGGGTANSNLTGTPRCRSILLGCHRADRFSAIGPPPARRRNFMDTRAVY